MGTISSKLTAAEKNMSDAAWKKAVSEAPAKGFSSYAAREKYFSNWVGTYTADKKAPKDSTDVKKSYRTQQKKMKSPPSASEIKTTQGTNTSKPPQSGRYSKIPNANTKRNIPLGGKVQLLRGVKRKSRGITK